MRLGQLGYATGKPNTTSYTRLGADCRGSASYTTTSDFTRPYIVRLNLNTTDFLDNSSGASASCSFTGASSLYESRVATQGKHYSWSEGFSGQAFDLSSSSGTSINVNPLDVSSDILCRVDVSYNDGLGASLSDSENFFVRDAVPPLSIDYLVVGGGGGGGMSANFGGGGGGGGGGVLTGTLSLTPGTYSISIGAGGAGYDGNVGTNRGGYSGSSSTFHTVTASGGGGGGSYLDIPGGSGGCGGGSGSGGNTGQYHAGPGSGISGQGFSGGDAQAAYNIGGAYNYYGAGGGGGASSAGQYGGAASAGAGGSARFYSNGQYYGAGGNALMESGASGFLGTSGTDGTGNGATSASFNRVYVLGGTAPRGGNGAVLINPNGASYSLSGLTWSLSSGYIVITGGTGTITFS